MPLVLVNALEDKQAMHYRAQLEDARSELAGAKSAISIGNERLRALVERLDDASKQESATEVRNVLSKLEAFRLPDDR